MSFPKWTICFAASTEKKVKQEVKRKTGELLGETDKPLNKHTDCRDAGAIFIVAIKNNLRAIMSRVQRGRLPLT